MVNLVYLRLKHFTALTNCTGKDEIIIDRYDSPNVLIQIVGLNGTGKSSLLMEMTPYPLEHSISRTIKRTDKDKIAEKEVHLVVNNRMKYICKIYYGSNKTSAYIYEEDTTDPSSGRELNPNGNISTYEEMLELKLGLTKNYQQIGYLSSDLNNFISMKAADRSRYLSNFLPDVSLFLKGYDIVSKKVNEKKREIDNINKELGKLDSINYETNIKNLKLSIESKSKSLDLIKSDLVKCQMFQDNLSKYENIILEKEKIKQLFLKYSNELDILGNKIKMEQNLINSYNSEDGEKKLKEDINELEKSLIKERENEYNLSKNIDKLFLSIKEKEMILNENSNDYHENLDEIIHFIDQYQKELEVMNNELNIQTESNKYLIDIFGEMKINEIYEFSKIMDQIIELSNQFEKIDENNSYNMSFLSEKIYSLEKENSSIEEQISNNKITIEELNNKISLLQSNEEMKKLYNLKDSCQSTTCRILKELEKYINIETEKDLLNKNKNLIEEKQDLLSKRIENIKSIFNSINNNINIINKINELIMTYKNTIVTFSEYLKNIFKSISIEEIIKELKKIKIQFNDFREYIHLKEKIKNLNNSLNELKVKKSIVISKNNLEKEMTEYDSSKIKREESLLNIKIIEEKLNELKTLSEIKEKIKKECDIYNEMRNELLDVKERLITLANIEYYLSHLKDIYIKLNINKNLQEKELQNLENEREVLKSEYINKQSLEKLRNELLEIKNKYEVLKSIWSVRDGYPALLLNNFLMNLKADVNRNLDEIWDNSLSIEDFVLTQTEFSIIINRNGMIIQDGSQCSSGEKAILTLALSLSIIEMNLRDKKYDVLRLDEIDGPLDPIRSSGYLSLLKERLERMNVSSCFLITHKSDFEEVATDLILLKGAPRNNLQNKNIIFQLD